MRGGDWHRFHRGGGIAAVAAGVPRYPSTITTTTTARNTDSARTGGLAPAPRLRPHRPRSRRPSLAVACGPLSDEGSEEDPADGGAGELSTGDVIVDSTAPSAAADLSLEEAEESGEEQEGTPGTPSSDSLVSEAGDALPSPTTSEVGRDRDDGAEGKAEAVLRKLSPSELAGMKPRLGLDPGLEGEEEIIARAVPILADKIRTKSASQEVSTSGSKSKRGCSREGRGAAGLLIMPSV